MTLPPIPVSSMPAESPLPKLFVPARYLMIEGIFALHFTELLPFFNLRVYIDTPDELCFERRLQRDIVERGRTPELVRQQYNATVRPQA